MNNLTIKKFAKKIIFAFAFLAFTSVSMMAQKVASVDVSGILSSMGDYTQAQEELDRTAARWRQEIAKEYDVIKGMYNKYQAEQVMMTDEMRRQKEEEIMAKENEVRELQKAKFGPEGDLFKKRQELVKPIQDRIYAVIQKFAADRGYDFIFDKGSMPGMLFGAPSKDKTEEVLDKMKL